MLFFFRYFPVWFWISVCSLPLLIPKVQAGLTTQEETTYNTLSQKKKNGEKLSQIEQTTLERLELQKKELVSTQKKVFASSLGSAGGMAGGDKQTPIPPAPPLKSSLLPLPPAPAQDPKATLPEGKRGNPNVFFQSRSSDACATSAQIDAKYGCTGTQKSLQTLQMSQMGLMMTGSLGVQATGGSQAMMAMQGNSQKAALEAMATTSQVSGGIQMGAATGTVGMGLYMMSVAHKRRQIGSKLEAGGNGAIKATEATESNSKTSTLSNNTEAGYASSQSTIGQQIVTKYNLNEELSREAGFTQVNATDEKMKAAQLQRRQEEGREHEQHVGQAVRDIASRAQAEQDGIASMALMNSVMTLGQGIQQMASASGSLAQGVLMQKAANNLKPITQAPVILPKFQSNAATAGGLKSNVITGSGAISGTGDSSQKNPSALNGPDLGQGFNPLPPGTGVSSAPRAGVLNNAGGNPAPMMPPGGVGAGMGGGMTAAEKPQEEEKATVAPNIGSPLYQAGSGGSFSKSGGSGNPKDNLDLSNILAKFLPQKEDVDKQAQNSIVNFDAIPSTDANQGIQSQRDQNLFKMVENAMIRNHQSGKI